MQQIDRFVFRSGNNNDEAEDGDWKMNAMYFISILRLCLYKRGVELKYRFSLQENFKIRASARSCISFCARYGILLGAL